MKPRNPSLRPARLMAIRSTPRPVTMITNQAAAGCTASSSRRSKNPTNAPERTIHASAVR